MDKVSGVCKVLITSRVRLSDTLSRPLPLSPLLPHHVHDHLSLSIPLPSSSLRTTIISLSPSLYHHPLYAPRSSLSLHPSTIIFSTHHDHLSLPPFFPVMFMIISLSPSLYHHPLYAPRSCPRRGRSGCSSVGFGSPSQPGSRSHACRRGAGGAGGAW